MKKLIMIGCILLGGAGLVCCEKEDTKSPDEPVGMPGAVNYELRVSYEEARQIAEMAIRMLEPGERSRSVRRAIDENNVIRYVANGTRAGDEGKTLMYVFNFDPEGFAVVATDRRVNALLAVADRGSYSPVRKTPRDVICGFDLCMNAALGYLEGLQSKPYKVDRPSEPGRMQIRHTPVELTEVEAMIPVKWGIRSPYNLYCPQVSGTRAQAGFAATAVAQIMTAFTYPKTMQLTYSGADAASISLNWPGILVHKLSSECDLDNCPEHRTIARMCREIGQQLNMRYGKEESTADFTAIPDCLRHFGFSADPVADYSCEAIRQSCDKRDLVCMRGTAVDVMKTYEHVWVVDGMMHHKMKTEIWFIPEKGPNRLLESTTGTERFARCNWGYNGMWNGCFSIDIFDPANPAKLDPGSEQLRLHNFTQSLKIVTGISPAK